MVIVMVCMLSPVKTGTKLKKLLKRRNEVSFMPNCVIEVNKENSLVELKRMNLKPTKHKLRRIVKQRKLKKKFYQKRRKRSIMKVKYLDSVAPQMLCKRTNMEVRLEMVHHKMVPLVLALMRKHSLFRKHKAMITVKKPINSTTIMEKTKLMRKKTPMTNKFNKKKTHFP